MSEVVSFEEWYTVMNKRIFYTSSYKEISKKGESKFRIELISLKGLTHLHG